MVSSLGVGPAKKEFNFKPGFEIEIEYKVSPGSNKNLVISAEGDLADYITFNKQRLPSTGGVFTATLKLPDFLETPGRHRSFIKVLEEVDPELVGFIGTSIAIKPVIDIYVPYPGQYLETSLSSEDVNIGEPVEFGLEVVSRGKEDVTAIPRIEIYNSEGSKVEDLFFSERTFPSQETISLKKFLDTFKFNPGNYKAVSFVDYGGLAKSETDFRVGALTIEILNYSTDIPLNKLQKFEIEIQSGWNDNIDGAYAEVVFLNDTGVLESFKTTTTSLIPWERKIIEGYLNTEQFSEGTYDANITVFYFGKNKGASSNKLVQVNFFKLKGLVVWYIVGGIGILIIIILLIIKFLRKNGKKKRKK